MRVVPKSIAISLLLLCGGGVAAGQSARKVIANPEPEYPELAKKMHLSGVVKVSVVIGADGRIRYTEFQGGHPVLVSSVENALKQWRYAPASAESTVLLEFKF